MYFLVKITLKSNRYYTYKHHFKKTIIYIVKARSFTITISFSKNFEKKITHDQKLSEK